MAKLGDLIVRVGADTREFNRELGKIQRQIRQTSDNIMDMGKSMTMGVTLPIVGLGAAAVKAAADLETMETQFISLTGGAEQAGAMVDQLNQFAAATPFQIEEIAGAARQLLAAGTDISQVNEQLGFLGDIAATSGESIEDITAIFAKVQAKGKVELENLNQLAERGIPIFTALSEATGLLPSQLGAGAVTVEQFNATLRGFAEEGGFAHGAMERLSQTAAGKFSTALDNLKQAGASLGNVLLPYVTAAIDKVTELAAGFMKLDDSTKTTIVVVAAIAAAIGPAVIAFGALHKGFVAVNLVLPMLQAGIMRVHAAIMANPYVAAAAAIGILAAAMLTYKDASDKAREAKEDFDESIKDKTGRAAMEQLAAAMRDTNVQLADARRKYDELKRVQEAQGARISDRTVSQITETAELVRVLDDQVRAYQRQYQEASKQEQQRIRDSRTMNEQTAARAANVEVSDKELDKLKALELARLKEAHAIEEATQAMRDQQLMEAATPAAVRLSGIDVPDLPPIELELPDEVIVEEAIAGGEALAAAYILASNAAKEFNTQAAQAIEAAAENTAISFGQMVGQAMAAGEGFKGLGRMLIGTLADLAVQVGKIAIGVGISVEGIKKALKSLQPAVAIAAGIALVALGTFAQTSLANTAGVTAFAEGGIVSGPTMGLVGEYPGAKTNPEVIAPLDKLRSMLGDAGGGNVTVTGRLDGRDLILSNERTTFNRTRTRS
jgi:tape measure domain-containing protein